MDWTDSSTLCHRASHLGLVKFAGLKEVRACVCIIEKDLSSFFKLNCCCVEAWIDPETYFKQYLYFRIFAFVWKRGGIWMVGK